LQAGSGPASPFGDLVELIAGEKLVVLKKLGNPIKTGFRAADARMSFTLFSSADIPLETALRPASAASNCFSCICCTGSISAKQMPMPRKGVRGANRARRLNQDAERLEYKSHFRAGGKRCVHFHIASVQADVGNGSPHARVVSLDSKLRAPRTTKPGPLPPLFPSKIVRGRRSFAAAPRNGISGRCFHHGSL
jgi:hypothetical protein